MNVALVALCLAPLLAQGPPVDIPIGEPIDVRLVEADAIVVARVDSLHPLPGTALELVELECGRAALDGARTRARGRGRVPLGAARRAVPARGHAWRGRERAPRARHPAPHRDRGAMLELRASAGEVEPPASAP